MQELVNASRRRIAWDPVLVNMLCDAMAIFVAGYPAAHQFAQATLAALSTAGPEELQGTCLLYLNLEALLIPDVQQAAPPCHQYMTAFSL